jgi:ubiquinone/menaquinone biosynthesis C-methylase UbiE
MMRARRLKIIGWASAIFVVTVLGATAVAEPPRWLRSLQWHLDIQQALDVVGATPGMIVGEAGAGDGYFTLPLAKRVGAQGMVYANDINRRSLDYLEQDAKRHRLTNIRTVVGDVDDPRFPRRDLELVVVVHAFHDFEKPVEWLVNLKQYLRPGGRVAVIDRDPAKGAESHFWPRDRIAGYAQQAGYRMVTSAEADTDHLILVFTPASS